MYKERENRSGAESPSWGSDSSSVSDDELVHPPVFIAPVWQVAPDDDGDLSGLELFHGDEQGICLPLQFDHHRGTHPVGTGTSVGKTANTGRSVQQEVRELASQTGLDRHPSPNLQGRQAWWMGGGSGALAVRVHEWEPGGWISTLPPKALNCSPNLGII